MARRLKIELDLDAKGFAATITDAASKTQKFKGAANAASGSLQRMEKRMHGVLATARDLTLVLSQVRTAIYNMRIVMTGWVESIIKTNIEIERMSYLLAGMSDKLTVAERFEEAADGIDIMLNKAKTTPFAIGALTDSFVKLKSVGVDPLDGSMQSLIDSVAAFGGDDQMLKRASIAIQQMGGKGVVSMEELRQQLGEAVPSAIRLMARSMGLTYQDLVDRISKGEVEASSALQKMFGEFERTFGGAAANLVRSFSGNLVVAKTSLIEFALAVGGFEKGGFASGSFMDTLNEKVLAFIDLLNTPEVKIFGKRLGEGLTVFANALHATIKIFWQFKDIIIAAGKAFALYFGSRIIGATIANLWTGLGALTGATGRLSTAFALTGTQIQRTTRRLQIANNRAVGMVGKTKLLTRGLRGVGAAFSTMLGPIGLFVTAAFFAAEAMGFFKDRTKEAEQAVQDFNDGLVSDQSLEVMENRLEQLIKKRARFIRTSEQLSRVGSNEQSEKVAAEAEQLVGEIEKLKTLIGKASEQLSFEKAERATQASISNLRRQFGDLTKSYDLEAQRLAELRDAASRDETLTAEERKKRIEEIRQEELANVRSFYTQQRQIAEKYQGDLAVEIAKLAVAMGGMGGTPEQQQKLKNLEASYAGVGKYITELIASAERAEGIFEAPNVYMESLDDDADDATKSLTAIESRLVSLNSKYANLQATHDQLTGKVSESSNELSKFNAEVKAGKYKEITKEQIAEARRLAEEIDRVTAANKRLKNDATQMGQLQQQFQRSTDYARAMTEQLVLGMTDAEVEAAEYASRLDLILAKMSAITPEAQKLRDASIEAFEKGKTVEYLNSLEEQTQAMKINLMDRRQAAEAEYQRDIQRMRDRVNMARLTGQERLEAERIVADYIEQRQRQLAETNKSATQRMLEDWQKTTEAMDQAAAGWIDDFADKLVEGELNFGEFAVSILKDIAKIIIRAIIASAIMAALGMPPTGGGFGGGFNPSSMIPTFHTGGVVGQNQNGAKRLNAGIFGGAPRYHTGGIAGLKPNEVPAVLEVGERVLTKDEQRAMASTGGGAPNVEVNIVNQGGEQMEEQSRNSRFDGEKYVIDIVTAAIQRPGKLRNATKEAAG